MKLEKLTDSIWDKIKNKKIYCYECDAKYLEEFDERFHLSGNDSTVTGDSRNRQGTYREGSRMITEADSAALVKSLEKEPAGKCAVMIAADYFRESYDRLLNTEAMNKFVDTVYYFANRETEYEETYRKSFEGHALENRIIFRSGPHSASYIKGMDFTDNSRALFEYMLRHGLQEKYELVWFVKNPEGFERYKKYRNVFFYSLDWSVSQNAEERDKYYKALCLAKYIFFTDAYGIARNSRKDQVRVQLWHGCGYKTRLSHSPCVHRYEYMTVTSELYAQIHQELFGLREEQMLITGLPKQDWLFDGQGLMCQQRLHIPAAEKYIYWLPTYRQADKVLAQDNGYELNQETGFPVVDTLKKMEQMNEHLREAHAILIIKLHPYQDGSRIKKIKYSNIITVDNSELYEEDIQLNQLLQNADALISDYSSVAVDFLLLDRPMAFLLEDEENYSQKRGFIFDEIRKWLPGKEIDNFSGMCAFIDEVAAGNDSSKEKRESLFEKMHRYGDGNNCRRVLEQLGIH